MNRIIFTCGDINGVGTEICIKTINKIYKNEKRKIILFCPHNILRSTFEIVKPRFSYTLTERLNSSAGKPNEVIIVNTGLYIHTPGVATKDSGKAAYRALQLALQNIGYKSDILITAPISKQALQLAGKNFPGHTEILASYSKTKNFMMLFLSNKMICGLSTIHEPVKKISGLITKSRVKNSLEVLKHSLIHDLNIKNPSIAVLGLNPHAGENGKIGMEEIKFIKPVIDSLKDKKIQGPFVPDAFFANHLYKKFDAVLGMYHDQVLIPFKMLNFDKGVNFTAGLPFVRTSPDHGTGFDIAGKGIANADSMIQAVKWAELIARNRKLN
ncbi:MAG: 4-hydroxythreonine-4-phosphate dehydrogenase PdxA [Bacteroidota bacterium]